MTKFEKLDDQDSLKGFKNLFYDSGEKLIYLDGNSLGMLPEKSRARVKEVVDEEWGRRLIRGWNDGWISLNERIGAKIAKLIGAKPSEVIVSDSTSLNLFKLAYGALKFQGADRNQIVSDELNFPSDLYVLQGLNTLFNDRYQINLAKSSDGISIQAQEISKLLNQQTALLTLSHVCFKSAYMYDMEQITQMAHDQGALVLWDLSHAVGAVPLSLNACDVDMAIGCTYKYLNGGPGSLAFLYVKEELQNKLENPIWAWLADEKPFDFNLEFQPASSIRRYTTSTPPVLSAAAIEPAVDMVLEAGMDEIRKKSVRMSEYLLELFDEFLYPLGFSLGSPDETRMRGSHVSVRHPEAYRISQAMIQPNGDQIVIIPDFRDPDYIRLGIAPLYLSYKDVYQSVMRMRQIVETKEYNSFSTKRDVVT